MMKNNKVPNVVRTAPEKIWLQVDPSDGSDFSHSLPFPLDVGEVSWCSEDCGGTEVEYIRADLVRKKQ